MYRLHDKLQTKYGTRLGSFSREFVDRVKALDDARGAQRDLMTYHVSRRLPVSGRAETGRVYYLLDTSAVTHIYVPDEEQTPKLDHFIEQKGLGKAFLFVPNFCVAETFSTFARLHYRNARLDAQQYGRCREAFIQDIHNGQLLYNYELNRYHILYIDHILPFEHLFEPRRPKGVKKGTEWTLSTFDMLIISVGMELARMTGNATYIVTCDRRLDKINQVLIGLSQRQREEYGIPSYLKFAKSLFLRNYSLDELPCVEGQVVT